MCLAVCCIDKWTQVLATRALVIAVLLIWLVGTEFMVLAEPRRSIFSAGYSWCGVYCSLCEDLTLLPLLSSKANRRREGSSLQCLECVVSVCVYVLVCVCMWARGWHLLSSFSLHIVFMIFFYYFKILCRCVSLLVGMYVYMSTCALGDQRCPMFWSWSYRGLWGYKLPDMVLGTELISSGRVASALSHWGFSG